MEASIHAREPACTSLVRLLFGRARFVSNAAPAGFEGYLLGMAEKLNEVAAGLRSLAEPWADTTSPAGRMVLMVLAGIAEFERALIHQRTSSGRVAAKARGVRFAVRPSSWPNRPR
jgi:hypothetical protein